jgi:succinate dehydrogenase / fumarate reductase cytochrome b subunit
MKRKRERIVFFDLLRIQMPVGALTSIGHRVTGILLVLGVPWAIYLLDLSLQGPQAYDRAVSLLDGVAVRVALVALAWALAHHAFAGLRHLLADVDAGSALPVARRSARLVNFGGLAVALLVAGTLL